MKSLLKKTPLLCVPLSLALVSCDMDVNNPPAEKTERTTIVTPPAEKTETTIVTPPAEKKE